MDILDYIPYGKENAIDRKTLEMLTGKPDRINRELISIARRKTPILNLQNGTGYFRPLPEEKELVEEYVRQEESRLKSIGWSLKAARQFVR